MAEFSKIAWTTHRIVDRSYYLAARFMPLWWDWQWNFVGAARWYFEAKDMPGFHGWPWNWEIDGHEGNPPPCDHLIWDEAHQHFAVPPGACPYPTGGDNGTAHECVKSGNCGCVALDRVTVRR